MLLTKEVEIIPTGKMIQYYKMVRNLNMILYLYLLIN